jgi:hypothetical protein
MNNNIQKGREKNINRVNEYRQDFRGKLIKNEYEKDFNGGYNYINYMSSNNKDQINERGMIPKNKWNNNHKKINNNWEDYDDYSDFKGNYDDFNDIDNNYSQDYNSINNNNNFSNNQNNDENNFYDFSNYNINDNYYSEQSSNNNYENDNNNIRNYCGYDTFSFKSLDSVKGNSN